MPHIDILHKQLIFKVVYFGPGMSGKTTNLKYLHGMLSEEHKGKMLVLDTDEERTLFFDFFPVSLGTVQGFALKFHLYTIPGQVYYEASRKLILEGADGVVFVADSASDRIDDNIDMYRRMQNNLNSFGKDLSLFPIVFQYNKRDLENTVERGTFEKLLSLPEEMPVMESVALKGTGVVTTLKTICSLIITRFNPDIY